MLIPGQIPPFRYSAIYLAPYPIAISSPVSHRHISCHISCRTFPCRPPHTHPRHRRHHGNRLNTTADTASHAGVWAFAYRLTCESPSSHRHRHHRCSHHSSRHRSSSLCIHSRGMTLRPSYGSAAWHVTPRLPAAGAATALPAAGAATALPAAGAATALPAAGAATALPASGAATTALPASGAATTALPASGAATTALPAAGAATALPAAGAATAVPAAPRAAPASSWWCTRPRRASAVRRS